MPPAATQARTRRFTRLEHDERREQILAAARRVFSERHYGAVSTEDIAREAGVARGLLHHYFGTKRELYVAVVRSMVHVPSQPVPGELDAGNLEQAMAESIERWLEMVRRNRETWLAVHGAQGIGRDPEIEQILEEGRERAAGRLIEALHPGDPAHAPRELRALIRAYAGLAEAASLEWLQRRRLTRAQVKELMMDAFFALVLPRAGRMTKTTQRRRTR